MTKKHKNTKQTKRIIDDLTVEFISLVDAPANGEAIVLKDQKGTAKSIALTKSDDELQRVYGIVYAVGEVDSDGDTVEDPAVIRKAANQFMKQSRQLNIDTQHSWQKEAAYVAESWLVKKTDPLFTDKKDAWAVGIQIEDPDLWTKVKNGDYTGISLGGVGRAREVEQVTEKQQCDGSGLIATIKEQVTKFLSTEKNQKKELEMEKQEVQAMIDEALAKQAPQSNQADSNAQLTKADVAALIEKALQPKPEPVTMEAIQKALDEKLAKALAKGTTGTDGEPEDKSTGLA